MTTNLQFLQDIDGRLRHDGVLARLHFSGAERELADQLAQLLVVRGHPALGRIGQLVGEDLHGPHSSSMGRSQSVHGPGLITDTCVHHWDHGRSQKMDTAPLCVGTLELHLCVRSDTYFLGGFDVLRLKPLYIVLNVFHLNQEKKENEYQSLIQFTVSSDYCNLIYKLIGYSLYEFVYMCLHHELKISYLLMVG